VEELVSLASSSGPADRVLLTGDELTDDLLMDGTIFCGTWEDDWFPMLFFQEDAEEVLFATFTEDGVTTTDYDPEALRRNGIHALRQDRCGSIKVRELKKKRR